MKEYHTEAVEVKPVLMCQRGLERCSTLYSRFDEHATPPVLTTCIPDLRFRLLYKHLEPVMQNRAPDAKVHAERACSLGGRYTWWYVCARGNSKQFFYYWIHGSTPNSQIHSDHFHEFCVICVVDSIAEGECSLCGPTHVRENAKRQQFFSDAEFCNYTALRLSLRTFPRILPILPHFTHHSGFTQLITYSNKASLNLHMLQCFSITHVCLKYKDGIIKEFHCAKYTSTNVTPIRLLPIPRSHRTCTIAEGCRLGEHFSDSIKRKLVRNRLHDR